MGIGSRSEEGSPWSTTGAWVIFVEGESCLRNPDKSQLTERQAEELVWELHNN